MAATSSRAIPEGWSEVSSWCIRSADGLFTICKIGMGDGEFRYELWHLKNQIAVNLNSAADAIRVHSSILATTSSNSVAATGAKSLPSQAGVQAELL